MESAAITHEPRPGILDASLKAIAEGCRTVRRAGWKALLQSFGYGTALLFVAGICWLGLIGFFQFIFIPEVAQTSTRTFGFFFWIWVTVTQIRMNLSLLRGHGNIRVFPGLFPGLRMLLDATLFTLIIMFGPLFINWVLDALLIQTGWTLFSFFLRIVLVTSWILILFYSALGLIIIADGRGNFFSTFSASYYFIRGNEGTMLIVAIFGGGFLYAGIIWSPLILLPGILLGVMLLTALYLNMEKQIEPRGWSQNNMETGNT